MITGTIKNKIDKIWLDIYAGGITNPLTVIEQLTYLMFMPKHWPCKNAPPTSWVVYFF